MVEPVLSSAAQDGMHENVLIVGVASQGKTYPLSLAALEAALGSDRSSTVDPAMSADLLEDDTFGGAA